MRLIIVLVLIASGLIGGSIKLFMTGPDGEYHIAAADEPLFTSKYDDRLLELEKQAIDNGYRQKAEDLIRVWFLEEHGQPARFLTGVRAARKKYIDMQNALEKREKDLETLRGLGADKK